MTWLTADYDGAIWDTSEVKRCTGCDKEKPLDGFRRNKRSRDGRTARCKACLNEQTRDWYERNLVTNRAKRNAYNAENRAAVRAGSREWQRRWREANPELARQQATARSRNLRERNPAYHREWYQRNIDRERDRARLSMARSRQENPELERARRRRYRLANADLVREREREKTYARRAMTASSPETAKYMTYLLTQPCAYCGATDNMTIDHIVPLSRGGNHEAANLAPACRSCNSSKCALLLEEWDGPPIRRAA